MIDSPVKIYKSSAGSGKTFTLVLEYLAIVLKNPWNYRHILAITFTNKAAAEMKERIVEALMEIAGGEAEDIVELLLDKVNMQEPEIRKQAGTVLSKILHDYANFAVSTIDSFTHRLVRNFAHDLELPSRFDVELDASSMLEKMIDHLVDQVGTNDYITEILIHFAEEKLKDRDDWNIERDLQSVAKQLFIETSQQHIQALHQESTGNFLEFIEFVKGKKDGFLDHFKELLQKCADLITQSGIPVESFTGASKTFAKKFFIASSLKKPADIDKVMGNKPLQKAYSEDKYTTKPNPEVEALLDEGLRSAIHDLFDYYESEFPDYATAWTAYQHIHSLAVLEEVEDLLEDYKERNNIVHISDFQKKINEFIEEESPDYIFWRLGDRYKFFMLDEFQDTSILQWKNLFPLFEDLKAQAEPEGTVLIVGDSKQAIYRFRGGEVELLQDLVPVLLDSEPLELDTNWRSKERIVEFNNDFFNGLRLILPENEMVNSIFQDFHQHTAPHNLGGGFVEITRLDQKKFKDSADELLLEKLAQVKMDGFRYSDVALLVRGGDDGQRLARLLSTQNIPVISSDSLLLYKEPVISFLVSLLKFLAEPGDEITRAEILHFHTYYQKAKITSDKILIEFNEESREKILASGVAFRNTVNLQLSEFLKEFPEEFGKIRWRLDRMPLYEVVEELIRIFDLKNIAQAYLQHFLDAILDYSEKHRSDLAGFLEHWEEKRGKYSVSVPSGVNAVQIMTIHKAKGLEFPVVFVPYANWGLAPHESMIWAEWQNQGSEYPDRFLVNATNALQSTKFADDFQYEVDRNVLDSVNLLYVAFTRPRERLYAFYQEKSDHAKWKTTVPREKISNVSDLIAGVILTQFPRGAEDVVDGYTTGFDEPWEGKRKEDSGITTGELLSVPWRKRIRIERKSRKSWNSGPAEADGEMQSIATHDSLAAYLLTTLRTAQDLPRMLKELVESGDLSSNDHLSLKVKMDRILSREPLKAWFSKSDNLYPNVEIQTSSEEVYRPGRLMRTDQKMVLAEFTPAAPEPGLAENQATLAEMLKEEGFEEVKTFIFDASVEDFVG